MTSPAPLTDCVRRVLLDELYWFMLAQATGRSPVAEQPELDELVVAKARVWGGQMSTVDGLAHFEAAVARYADQPGYQSGWPSPDRVSTAA